MAAPAGQTVSSTPAGRGSPVFQQGTPDNKDGGPQVVSDGKTNPVPTPTGPLAPLGKNKYFTNESLKYPRDLNTERFPHFLRFHINIPAKSAFTTTFEQAGGSNRTDYNRYLFGQSGFGQVGSSTDPFMILGSAGAGGAVTGALYGATQLLNDLARNATDGTLKQEKNDASGALVGAAGAAFVGATVLATVDMTRKTKRLVQSIDLYIPDQVIMQSQNKYGEVSLTSALGLAGLAGQGAGAVGGSIKDTITNIGNNVKAGLGGGNPNGMVNQKTGAPGAFLAESMASLIGGAGKELGIVGEGIENVLLQSYGIAQNPQIEVLFETIDNRTFEFNFAFHPRNDKEAEDVLKIIRMFRYHAAPELAQGTGGRYFVPPSEFDIEYRFKPGKNENDIENEALHKFATCVLEAIDVNYVGQSGQFVTFKDGKPVNIEMRLRFKEVEIIHKGLVEAGY
jgi:hypothetical protein